METSTSSIRWQAFGQLVGLLDRLTLSSEEVARDARGS